MHGLRIAASVLIVLSAGLVHAQVRGVHAVDTRAYGFMIGDLVPRAIEIEVERGWTLQATSLPAPGAQRYWLDLRSVRTSSRRDGDVDVLRIDLDYQTFYAPIQALERTLPGFDIGVTDGTTVVQARVPEAIVTMSPLREVKLGSGGVDGERTIVLRPDALPTMRDTRSARIAVAACTVLVLLAFAAVVRRHAWWPFHARPDRPFAHASRALRRTDDAHYDDHVRRLHRAFDTSAGRRLFAEDVAAWLAARPAFATLAEPIGRFFAASRALFFAGDGAAARTILSVRELVALAGALAVAERRTR
ncbi:hypothetical protein ACQQ2N_03860 [Dokdonella sp. MW10]|uniref:hypothetical protein n=1 Tax=Dokdonella sp. MW10 TaxID=2992926 RepID=UPI003F81BAF0